MQAPTITAGGVWDIDDVRCAEQLWRAICQKHCTRLLNTGLSHDLQRGFGGITTRHG